MSNDVECPYCGAEQEINHDDGQGYDEGVLHRQECTACGKTYAYETSIDVSHEAFAAPCIDGDAEHDWEETGTIPRCFRKLRCSVCGEEKEIEGIEVERKAYIEHKNKIIEQMRDALRLALPEARSTHCENAVKAALAAERGE